jgi:diaminopimelate dehydrogenase
MKKIRIGIVGYGNLGRSAELGIRQNGDMELAGVFTRRNPSEIKLLTDGVGVYNIEAVRKLKDKIDVMILCGGSATDLPIQGPELAGIFNTVDGFDTHAKIPEYFKAMDEEAKANKNVCVISSGWDPGMFSINRLYGEVILPKGKNYTFWGKGVSQGHSDAIRRIKGVKQAKQYTIPVEAAINSIRNGETPELTSRQKHIRECFVVAEEDADKKAIEKAIKTMPNYFADYDTIVHFISMEEFEQEHAGLAHGGFVLQTGRTGLRNENNHIIEYSLKLDSNPDFTANVLLAYARAAFKLQQEGIYGAKTVFDIAPAYLSAKSAEELRSTLL